MGQPLLGEKTIRRRKMYLYVRDPQTGKRVRTHRWLVEQALGRPLLLGEVVHHKDGNSLNNDLSNLIVLPNQRVHAHVEFHSRRAQTGMPSLFPELFTSIPEVSAGSLFDCVLLWRGQEPPMKSRRQREGETRTDMPKLLPCSLDETRE
ncbi:HNH endonuclease signature motif containing protein [Deinococcus sp. VB343]|uniref:HNH endonuclease signature motif containing protein n=1 Tax=Deinococcus sp. VB142 TaxID=3112952 RepID=A0AAU6Q829_9DEIO